MQLSFLYMFYWAAFTGKSAGQNLVDFFMGELGFSPFVCLYKGHCPVVGAILAGKYNMFKYLVKHSNKGFKVVHADKVSEIDGDDGDLEDNKYCFINKEDEDLFEKSRLGQDKYGNNIMHFIFFLPDMPEFRFKYKEMLEADKNNYDDRTKIRNIFLKLAIEEDLGDLTDINMDNYLPY